MHLRLVSQLRQATRGIVRTVLAYNTEFCFPNNKLLLKCFALRIHFDSDSNIRLVLNVQIYAEKKLKAMCQSLNRLNKLDYLASRPK